MQVWAVRVEKRDRLGPPPAQAGREGLNELVGIAHAHVDVPVAELALEIAQKIRACDVGVEEVIGVKRAPDAERPAG